MIYKLYLESLTDSRDQNDDKLVVTLETSIVLFLLEFVERPSCIQIFLVSSNRKSTEPGVKINKKPTDFITLTTSAYSTELASNCSFPVIVSENVVIAGLCSVCRAIVKHGDKKFRYILGFRETCLQAPSEASPWTKFCEIDILTCTKSMLKFHQQLEMPEECVLPQEIGYVESHLSGPVKAFNISKLTIDITRGLRVTDQPPSKNETINSEIADLASKMKGQQSKKSILAKNIVLEHKFLEGPQIAIADVILFPYFWLMTNMFGQYAIESLQKQFPLSYKWMESVENYPGILNCIQMLKPQSMLQSKKVNYIVQNIESFTLYKRNAKRQIEQRVFTRDENIEKSLIKINQLGMVISSVPSVIDGIDDDSDWQLPFDALPEGGNLPANRLQRKKDQLFSLAKEIICIAKDGDRIVDFCSGQGHLAIILAYKLPQCLVYVLDNKEEMLRRAKQRVQRLNLTNIRFFQSNLDYFIGDFDIGTSLHACGIATDIVLLQCKQRNAHFVCCPCCYGKVIEMPHITFPRSKFFRSNNITLNEYLCIAHCADQGHDTTDTRNNVEKSFQGKYCMDIIDTDRKLYMEECDYNVKLTRLHPEDCTLKNRLLIGTKQQK